MWYLKCRLAWNWCSTSPNRKVLRRELSVGSEIPGQPDFVVKSEKGVCSCLCCFLHAYPVGGCQSICGRIADNNTYASDRGSTSAFPLFLSFSPDKPVLWSLIPRCFAQRNLYFRDEKEWFEQILSSDLSRLSCICMYMYTYVYRCMYVRYVYSLWYTHIKLRHVRVYLCIHVYHLHTNYAHFWRSLQRLVLLTVGIGFFRYCLCLSSHNSHHEIVLTSY